jgi:ABC-2 type transport system ATP-binding protein
MDEAERCHRVALMHAGRLLALDTVPALKASIPPGRLVEVSCPRPAQALAVIETIAGVGEAALFGDRLHALLAEPSLAATIGERLGAAGFVPVTVGVIAPSLEDAFIHIISRAELGPEPGIDPRLTAHGPRLGGAA